MNCLIQTSDKRAPEIHHKYLRCPVSNQASQALWDLGAGRQTRWRSQCRFLCLAMLCAWGSLTRRALSLLARYELPLVLLFLREFLIVDFVEGTDYFNMVSFFMSLSFQIPSLLFQPGVSENEIKDQIRVLKNEQLGIKIEVGVGRVHALSFSASCMCSKTSKPLLFHVSKDEFAKHAKLQRRINKLSQESSELGEFVAGQIAFSVGIYFYWQKEPCYSKIKESKDCKD